VKKTILCALLFLFAFFPVCGQFVNYPGSLNNGTVILNGGVGFGGPLEGDLSMKVPPLLINFDFAVPIASQPFTVGFALAYSAEKGTIEKVSWSTNNLGVAIRFAYHVALPLPRLDTYLSFNFGDILSWQNASASDPAIPDTKNKLDANNFWYTFGAGARYFFTANFGAFAELGFSNFDIISFGVCYKI